MHDAVFSRRSPVRFLFLWVLANLIGGFLAGFLEDNGLQFMATLVLTGAIVGTAQWLVLRPWGGFRWWPVASAIGWIVGTFSASLLQGLYRPAVDFLWHQVGLWEVFWINLIAQPLWVLTMAIAQGIILRRRALRRVPPASNRPVGVWILASLAGAVGHGAVSASLCAAWCPALPSALVGIVNGLGWATYGLITGLVVIKLPGPGPHQETE